MSREARGVSTEMNKQILPLALSAILFTLCAVLLAPSFPVHAQQSPAKVPRIGFLTTGAVATEAPRIEAFRQGLRELGYVEGKNIDIEYRYAEGRSERLPELAEQLVRLKVDLIVAADAFTARAAKKATTTIPIVMTSSGDPIRTGLIASLARPGGNVTGLTSLTTELLGKRLELLKEAVPKISRVGVLYTSTGGGIDLQLKDKDTQTAAQLLGVKLEPLLVTLSNPDFEGAFRAATSQRVEALITGAGSIMNSNRKRILELAIQNRLPAMHSFNWAADGGLMYYGTNSADLYRRAATYVDKILKGAKPADLPVEQPTKFDLVINLKTAKQIGVTIPQKVLVRADKVIK
jgi:putative ABC transport system substrate-binding protein